MRPPAFWTRRPGVAAALLSPVAALYDRIATRRMTHAGAALSVPVICIGNPTLGGAGKTPTAIAVAQLLTAAGERPVLLSRGYGGRLAGPVRVDPARHLAADVGDEPLLLARAAPVVVARDRVAGAHLALSDGASVIVMDDGFQNPSLRKDFSILVVDGGSGIGNGRVFPAGPLRASLDAQLARAQALLVIGEDRHGVAAWGASRGARLGGLPVFHGTLVPDTAALAALRGQRLLAYAGIGAPAKFFGTLHAAGLDVAETAAFPDHHRFTDADIADLLRRADRGGLTPVSTEKDCVRLAGNPAAAALAARTLALPVTLAVQEQDVFAALVRDGLGAARAGRVSS